MKLHFNQEVKDTNREVEEWAANIGTIATGHTQVTGMLAGFSATIVVLIIGLRFGSNLNLGNNPPAATSLGIFAMAFFGYVATGILYSISVERYEHHRYFLFSAAGITYYFSVVLSFSAVYPLILLIQSSTLQWGVFIMVIGGLFGGYLAAAIPLYDLLLIKFKYLLGVFMVSASVGFAFYFLLASGFKVQSPILLFWLLNACATVVVITFNLVALTFFFNSLNGDVFYRRTSLVLIAFATATLCFTIAVGANAGS